MYVIPKPLGIKYSREVDMPSKSTNHSINKCIYKRCTYFYDIAYIFCLQCLKRCRVWL